MLNAYNADLLGLWEMANHPVDLTSLVSIYAWTLTDGKYGDDIEIIAGLWAMRN